MIYYAHFSKEYRLEIEASNQEEAWELARNMTPAQVETSSNDYPILWDVEEEE